MKIAKRIFDILILVIVMAFLWVAHGLATATADPDTAARSMIRRTKSGPIAKAVYETLVTWYPVSIVEMGFVTFAIASYDDHMMTSVAFRDKWILVDSEPIKGENM